MAIQEKVNSAGESYTEVWAGAGSAPKLAATFTKDGLELPTTDALEVPTLTSGTSMQSPLVVAGNADAQVTARTGGTVRASDVATGGAGNIAGADLTLRGGKGTGTGTPGKVLLQAAPTASSGDNAQVPATVATVSSSGVELAASKALTAPTAIVGNTDAAVTARTGGTVRAPDVATGGAGNVAGADVTIRPGKGTGTGTPGTIVLQAAPVASAGDNAQVPATVATIGAAALIMAASTNLIVATKTPASAAAAGVAGTVAWDADYVYVCTATNTWKRAAIATW